MSHSSGNELETPGCSTQESMGVQRKKKKHGPLVWPVLRPPVRRKNYGLTSELQVSCRAVQAVGITSAVFYSGGRRRQSSWVVVRSPSRSGEQIHK